MAAERDSSGEERRMKPDVPSGTAPAEDRVSPIWHAAPWLIALAYYFLASGYLSLGTNILVYILLTLSLDLALGYAGIITLGHAAFFGFGAYAAGLFAVHVYAEPVTGLVAATVLTGIFAMLTGMLILHTQGVTLLMLTLAISILLAEWANRAHSVTGGDDGLQVTMRPVLGLFRFDLWGNTAYLYSLVVLFIWFVASWSMVHSPFGRSLDGIRQSPQRMRAIGTPVWWRLVVVYAISGAMAGTAGALSAQTTRFVGLNTLHVLISGIAVVMLVLGGTKRLYGAFIGAAIYVVVQDFAAKINPFYWMFVIGGLLMATVMFLEGGLMEVLDIARRKARQLSGRAKP
jgi:branched-chain amino acid transport system permease protein